MNRRTLITCLSVLAVLVALVVAGVVMLYAPGKGYSDKDAASLPKSDYKLFQAIPSDAAMLMAFSKASDAFSVLNDSTQVFSVLMTDATSSKHPFSNFIRLAKKADLGSLRYENAVISLHYSGTLEPLMVISAGSAPSDTTDVVRRMMALADSAKILHSLVDCSDIAPESSRIRKSMLLLLSSSETLLTASRRHIEGGMSILDKASFPQAAADASGHDAVFVSHDYASKLFPVYLQKPYTSHSTFFSRFADWSVLAIRSNSSKKIAMAGSSVSPSKEQTAFVNVFSKVHGAETQFASIVPASALFAVSVSASDIKAYGDAYLQYLDAAGRQDRFNSVPKALKDSLGVGPLQWFEKMDVKEVAKADVIMGEEIVSLLFVRPGKNVKEAKEVHENPYHGYVSSILGSLFTADDSHAAYRNGWLVLGPEAAVDAVGYDNLKSELSAMDFNIPEKGNNLTAYFSVSKYPAQLEKIFKPAMVKALGQSLMGVTDMAAVLTVNGTSLNLEVSRSNVAPSGKSASASTSQVAKDTSVPVPEGPFKVKNSGTGKTNLFSQAANGTLSLKDENGKGLWGVPFQGRICGRVESIDYYANDKIQFLFASGSKLYLIDRLGRFVNPFPVDLGKTIVLGPAAYDFTGAKGYTAMVLHDDNTIGMYDLHGNLRQGWQGITSEETIKSLPELVEAGGKKYWAVRTSVQTLIYPFMGGDPLTKLTGDKMIRPDSEIAVKDGTISATSLDGKVRNVKL